MAGLERREVVVGLALLVVAATVILIVAMNVPWIDTGRSMPPPYPSASLR